MGRLTDWVGRRIGALTVVERGPNDAKGKPQWACRCDCGNEALVRSYFLASQQATSCGCGIYRAIKRSSDIEGQVFGHLTVMRRLHSKPKQGVFWLCRCVCGAETVVRAPALKNGHTQSCGCLRGESATRHGHSGNGKDIKPTPTYYSWANMIARCTQPSSPAFPHYRKRGITICDRWRSFENFLADMGPRPPSTSLDRWPDNHGNYEPGNCRWATKREQANNRVTNLSFTYRGQQYTLAELARTTGVAKDTLRVRLVRPGGWTVKRAVETPVIPRSERRRAR